MRRFSFLDWLDELTDGPVGRILKGLLAGLLLASLLALGYRFVRDYQADLKARNEQLQRDLQRK